MPESCPPGSIAAPLVRLVRRRLLRALAMAPSRVSTSMQDVEFPRSAMSATKAARRDPTLAVSVRRRMRAGRAVGGRSSVFAPRSDGTGPHSCPAWGASPRRLDETPPLGGRALTCLPLAVGRLVDERLGAADGDRLPWFRVHSRCIPPAMSGETRGSLSCDTPGGLAITVGWEGSTKRRSIVPVPRRPQRRPKIHRVPSSRTLASRRPARRRGLWKQGDGATGVR